MTEAASHASPSQESPGTDSADPASALTAAGAVIASQLAPSSVLDVSGMTSIAEGLRARGLVVESLGDVSELTHHTDDLVDLIICIDVMDRLPSTLAPVVVEAICRRSGAVLFSSSPDDIEDPSRINVQPPEYWANLFAGHGFFRNFDHDVSYVNTHAVVFERRPQELDNLVRGYERLMWLTRRSAEGARSSAGRLQGLVTVLTAQLEESDADRHHLAHRVRNDEREQETLRGERDRLESLLAVERGIFDSQLAQLRESTERAHLELDAMKHAKVFRYTAGIRQAYGRLLRSFRRSADSE